MALNALASPVVANTTPADLMNHSNFIRAFAESSSLLVLYILFHAAQARREAPLAPSLFERWNRRRY
jgi:hypothetical protein